MKLDVQVLRNDLGPIEIDVEKLVDDQIAAQDFGLFGAIIRPVVHTAVVSAINLLNQRLAAIK